MKWVRFLKCIVESIGKVTPVVKNIIAEALEEMLDRLEEVVEKTPTEVDDALVRSLREILNMPDLPDDEQAQTPEPPREGGGPEVETQG